MDPLGPLRGDAILSDISRDSDNNCATLAKNERDMDRTAVSKNTFTPTVASNYLAKIGIKLIVSTLHQYSQRPVDASLPTRGSLLFFSEEAEVNMANTVVVMRWLKACVTRHNVVAEDNSMQKGTPTAKIFNNDSVLSGWYQNWL